MQPKETSATKVINILNRARQTSGQSTVLGGWASVFQTQQDVPAVAGKVVRLCNLIKRLESDLIKANVDTAVYRDVYTKLSRVIDEGLGNLAATWDNIRQKITDDILVGLNFSHSILRSNGILIPVMEKECSDCLSIIEEIEKAIKSLDIDGDLKAHIMDQLRSLRGSIKNFRDFGEKDLPKEILNIEFVNATYGGLLIDSGFEAFPEKMGKLIGTLHSIVKVFNDGAKFIEYVTKALPPVS